GSVEDALRRTRESSGTGERIAVRLEPGSPKAQSLLPAVGGNARVAKAIPSDDGQALTIELAPGEHGHHFLLELLMSSGAKIAAFQPQAPRLEDAFLRLTTGALQ